MQKNIFDNVKVGSGSHIILLYRDKSELLEFLPKYYCEGFKRKEVCFLVMDNDAMVDSIKSEILTRGIIDEKQMSERLSFVDYHKLYFSVQPFNTTEVFRKVDGIIEKNKSAGIRTCGDMTWVDESNFDKFLIYEEGLSGRYRKDNVILMCAYCTKNLNSEQLKKMMDAHTHIILKQKGAWKLLREADSGVLSS